MMLDKQNTLSDQQSIVGTGNIVSTNSIDTFAGKATMPTGPFGVAALNDTGRAATAEVLCQITESVVGGTSIQAQLIESSNADLSSPTIVNQSDAIAVASLEAGYQFRVALLPGMSLRYFGIRYVIVGTTTVGKVTAGIVLDKSLGYSF